MIALAGLLAGRYGVGGGAPAWSTSIGLAVALAVFLVWLTDAGRTLRLGRARLGLPSTRTGLVLVALGAIENGAAIAALYVLLPATSAPPFLPFALSYFGAVALGVASQVPGGIGVFEATLMSIWLGRIGGEPPVALLVYRLVYNILPRPPQRTLAGGSLAAVRAHELCRHDPGVQEERATLRPPRE